MMSWSERHRRRGAITREMFLLRLTNEGFVEVPARQGYMHEFEHPATGRRRYVVQPDGRGYSAHYDRLLEELKTGTSYMGGVQ